MNDKLDQTQRILRSAKVATDDRGRTVWVDPVETAKLELVSTQMLKQIIDSDDGDNAKVLRDMAAGDEGLVARDVDDGRFQIISDEELQHILDGTEQEYAAKEAAQAAANVTEDMPPADEDFELVSTQMLRVILGTELDDEKEIEKEAGFNPYDNS